MKAKEKEEKREIKEKLEREQIAQRAFMAWQSTHSKDLMLVKEKLATRKPAKPRPMWVQDKVVNAELRQENKVDRILSPPNLYNDYSLTKKYCGPEYFRKYGLLVASGGNVPEEKERISLGGRKLVENRAKRKN